MSEIEIGDVVLIRGGAGRQLALVKGVRLGRLVVDRFDGRASGPVTVREVARVFKDAGQPTAAADPGRVHPTAQLRLDM